MFFSKTRLCFDLSGLSEPGSLRRVLGYPASFLPPEPPPSADPSSSLRSLRAYAARITHPTVLQQGLFLPLLYLVMLERASLIPDGRQRAKAEQQTLWAALTACLPAQKPDRTVSRRLWNKLKGLLMVALHLARQPELLAAFQRRPAFLLTALATQLSMAVLSDDRQLQAVIAFLQQQQTQAVWGHKEMISNRAAIVAVAGQAADSS